MGTAGTPTEAPKVAPEAPLPRRAREIPPKAGVREYTISYYRVHNSIHFSVMNIYIFETFDYKVSSARSESDISD